MDFNPEIMWHCFDTNPIPYNLRKGNRLLTPPVKYVNLGTNSITFRGSLSSNNHSLRLKNNQQLMILNLSYRIQEKSTAFALNVSNERLSLYFYSYFWFLDILCRYSL